MSRARNAGVEVRARTKKRCAKSEWNHETHERHENRKRTDLPTEHTEGGLKRPDLRNRRAKRTRRCGESSADRAEAFQRVNRRGTTKHTNDTKIKHEAIGLRGIQATRKVRWAEAFQGFFRPLVVRISAPFRVFRVFRGSTSCGCGN